MSSWMSARSFVMMPKSDMANETKQTATSGKYPPV